MARSPSGGMLAALAGALVLVMGLAFPAAAQDRTPLTPAAIAAFEQQLSGARAAHDDIATRVACFDRQKTALVQQRDKDQLKLGELMRHRLELEPVLITQAAQYRDFEKVRNDEQARLFQLRRELAELQQRKDAQEREVADCKARPWTLNFLCDFASTIAHGLGLFVDNERQITDTQRRLDTAAQAARDAEGRYRDSKRANDTAVADSAITGEQIAVAEAAIKRWQAALSTLETNTQDSKLLLDEFDDALDEARRVDTADGKARTARNVRDLAQRVDAATRRSGELLGQAKTTLTEQQLRSCF